MNDKIYGLSNDYLFKKIFRKKSFSQQLLQDLFKQKVTILEYLEKEFKKENKELSYGICDLLLKTRNKKIVLELQNKDLKNIEPRMYMYLSKLYTENWSEKEYRGIKPIEILLILNYPYKSHQTLKKYKALEKNLMEEFGKYLNIKIWNIKEALKEKNTINYKYGLLFSLEKYEASVSEQILKTLEQEERFLKIVKQIREYNMKKEEYQKMKEAEMMEMTFEQATAELVADAKKIGRKEGMKKGEIKGRLEGNRETMMKMIKNMVTENIPIEIIMKITSLSKKEIEQYKELAL